MSIDVENATRDALRAACKEAGIKCSKMPVADMRLELKRYYKKLDGMTATEALDADIADARRDTMRAVRDAFPADEFDAMDRPALCAALAEYELDCDGKTDGEVRSELRQLKLNAANDDAAEQARADAEYEARRKRGDADKQAVVDQDAALEAGAHPMLGGQAIKVHNTALPKSGNDAGNCPHCGKSTRNGKNVTEYAEMSPGSQNSTTQQFTCNDCAGEWGPVVDKPKRARAPSGSSNGLQIEKDRPTSNGVTRPSAGGKCRGIWDMLDSMGRTVTAAQARDAGKDRFDRTTIMVQFYRWRKFNGIEGRQA